MNDEIKKSEGEVTNDAPTVGLSRLLAGNTLVRDENLLACLNNWEFKSACQHLEGEDEGVCEIVKTLSRLFGDVGQFEGDLSTLIMCTLASIGIYDIIE